jgi:hypothetical protein
MWPALAINFRDGHEYHSKTTHALVDLNEEDSLKRTVCMLTRQRDAGRYHNIDVDNRSFEIIAKYIYFGTVLISRDFIHEKLRAVLILGKSVISLFL